MSSEATNLLFLIDLRIFVMILFLLFDIFCFDTLENLEKHHIDFVRSNYKPGLKVSNCGFDKFTSKINFRNYKGNCNNSQYTLNSSKTQC